MSENESVALIPSDDVFEIQKLYENQEHLNDRISQLGQHVQTLSTVIASLLSSQNDCINTDCSIKHQKQDNKHDKYDKDEQTHTHETKNCIKPEQKTPVVTTKDSGEKEVPTSVSVIDSKPIITIHLDDEKKEDQDKQEDTKSDHNPTPTITKPSLSVETERSPNQAELQQPACSSPRLCDPDYDIDWSRWKESL